MSLSAKLRRTPARLVGGAFILNAGIGKLSGDDDTAKAVHGMAVGTYPFLEKVEPKLFLRGLAVGEIALGGALLLPVVPATVAGLGLTGFAGSLLGVYWRTPGMHEEGDPRPTQRGTAIAKDVWMLGLGVGLLVDAFTSGAHDKKVALAEAAHDARRNVAAGVHDKRVEATHQLRLASVSPTIKAGRLAKSAKKASRRTINKVKH